jgi:hypothetical protein
MPFVVIFMKYPTHIVNEVVQKAVEANQKKMFPDEEDLYEVLVRSAWKTTAEGLKAMSVIQVKEGKLEEVLKSVYKEMLYFSELEGLESNVEVWGTWREAFELMGMEIPSD